MVLNKSEAHLDCFVKKTFASFKMSRSIRRLAFPSRSSRFSSSMADGILRRRPQLSRNPRAIVIRSQAGKETAARSSAYIGPLLRRFPHQSGLIENQGQPTQADCHCGSPCPPPPQSTFLNLIWQQGDCSKLRISYVGILLRTHVDMDCILRRLVANLEPLGRQGMEAAFGESGFKSPAVNLGCHSGGRSQIQT